MQWHSDQQEAPQYCTIFESELRQIAGVTATWRGLETGGILMGDLTHAGRFVVGLALPPGPNATHEVARFVDDVDHVVKTAEVLRLRYGLQLAGTHHSHHELCFAEPSEIDLGQVQSISARNGFTRLLQIICTYRASPSNEPMSALSDDSDTTWDSPVEVDDPVTVFVKAFVYFPTQCREPMPCALRVIPGLSPFRHALIACGALPDSALGHHAFAFPMADVRFDPAEPDAADTPGDLLPADVLEECRELLPDLDECVSFEFEDSSVVVKLPLGHQRYALVAYSLDPPHVIQAIELQDGPSEHARDVTGQILRGRCRMPLRGIHGQVRLLPTYAPPTRSCSLVPWLAGRYQEADPSGNSEGATRSSPPRIPDSCSRTTRDVE